MAFKYDYVPVDKLEDQTRLEIKILAEGDADFKVKAVFEKDKDGNQLTTMAGISKIRVLLSCKDKKGDSGAIFHDISANMPWAIKTLCDAVGLPALYHRSGTLDTAKLVGLEGKCVLQTKPAEGKYEAKTVIKQYVPHPGGVAPEQAHAGPGWTQDDEDEEIPF